MVLPNMNAGETKNNSRRAAIWSTTVLALALAIIGVVQFNQPPDSNQDNLVVPASQLEHFKGNASAKVVLVEHSDFQCPACANFYPVIRQLSDEFGDRVKFVYKHFPLRSVHKNADASARASLAAAKQGKFWEMHDKLFENQKRWSDAFNAETLFVNYAGELGLDADQFRKDLRADDVRERVEQDYQSAISLGLSGTPTFILNGAKLSNQSYEGFREKILAAIAANP